MTNSPTLKEIIKPILVLAAICLVVTGAIALINDATYPIIAEANAERTRATMIEIVPGAPGFELIESDALPSNILRAYRVTDGSGYIFIISSNGFGGNMRVICGVDVNGKIIEVRTLQHSETKGLGDYIDKRSFTGQFDGKDLSGIPEIDSVTGATITFNAFIDAVENALEAFSIIAE